MRLTRPRSLKAIVVIAAAAAVAPALSGRTQSINGAVLHDSAVVFAGHEHITNRVFSEGIDPWKPQPVGIAPKPTTPTDTGPKPPNPKFETKFNPDD